MQHLLPIIAALALAEGASSTWVERLAVWDSGKLEQLHIRISNLQQQLAVLPEMTPINSSLRIGLKTGYTTEEDVRWIEMTLPQAAIADSVVMLPPLAKAATAVVAGYGFPPRFLLEIFDDQNHAQVVMDKTQEDFPNPGCYPVVARFAPTMVKRVRFTATQPWSKDGPEVLAMAEMLILSGNHNLALEAKVTSSSTRNAPRAWARNNLVDMVTPLGLPVVRQPGGTLGFHSAISQKADEAKTLTLALPETTELDEIRLVPVRRREVPLWFDYGFPIRFQLEAATHADFSDGHVIYEVTDKLQPSPGMNLVCIPCRGESARYLRLTTKQLWEHRGDFIFALAEFQAFSKGENVAPRGAFTASDTLSGDPAWSLAALSDGLVESGRLISLPEWFAQLQQRQILEQERNQLVAERQSLLDSAEHTLVNLSIGSVAGITLLSGALFWRQHRTRLRYAQRLHEKLARDLHDEIGSNLGSIRLICSFASQPDITLDTLRADLADIERVAAESADSMRDMVQLISPRRANDSRDWLDVLQALTERLLRGHTLDCLVPTEPLSREPDIETRREIYLLCKEILHNIARHAQATRVLFHLSPTPQGLHVEISDDGIGFDVSQSGAGHGLGNIRERANTIGATLDISSQPGNGTRIKLEVPKTHHWQPC